MICFWKIKYTIISGRIAIVVAANMIFHSICRSPLNIKIVSGRVLAAFPCSNTSGYIKSFQTRRVITIIIVTIGAFNNGNTIFQNTLNGVAPSILAASSSATGTVFIKPLNRKIAYDAFAAIYTKITPSRVFPR